MIALFSVWIALGALATTIVMAATHWGGRETAMMLLPYTYALSSTLAAGVLWGLRKRGADETGVAGQRIQSMAAITTNTLALAILLVFANGWLYGFAGLAIEIAFLAVCYWGYTRVVRPE